MYLQKRPGRKLSIALCLLFSSVVSIVSNGCTMCPSPFDYSGTVPGAANQNDFRVRANGILPIWRRPKPWPPVVSLEAEEPRLATGKSIDDTSTVSRVIVASHDEELSIAQQNSSVLIDHAPQAVPANEEEQTETTNSISSEKVDTASSKES